MIFLMSPLGSFHRVTKPFTLWNQQWRGSLLFLTVGLSSSLETVWEDDVIFGMVVRLYIFAAFVQSLSGETDACSRMISIVNRLADSDRLGSGVLVANRRKCAARLFCVRGAGLSWGVVATKIMFLTVPWYRPVSGAASWATTVESSASCRSCVAASDCSFVCMYMECAAMQAPRLVLVMDA